MKSAGGRAPPRPATMASSAQQLAPAAVARVLRELRDLQRDPIDGVKVRCAARASARAGRARAGRPSPPAARRRRGAFRCQPNS